MIKMKKILFLIACCLPCLSYAMFCPTNFSQINTGDTIDQVTLQCGKPDKINKYKSSPDAQPQEWNYYVKPDPKQPNTLKMSVAFDADQKVVNISVNGTSLIATTICGANIKVGDTAADIKNSCGQAAFKNQSTQSNTNTGNESEVIEYTYNSSPPITFLFKQGKLTGTK